MDCIGIGNMAFIAIVNTIENKTHNVVVDGSPVFQVQHSRTSTREQVAVINIVQYFSQAFQNRVILRLKTKCFL